MAKNLFRILGKKCKDIAILWPSKSNNSVDCRFIEDEEDIAVIQKVFDRLSERPDSWTFNFMRQLVINSEKIFPQYPQIFCFVEVPLSDERPGLKLCRRKLLIGYIGQHMDVRYQDYIGIVKDQGI